MSYVCTHLTLGIYCSCILVVTRDLGSSSFSTKKRKLCSKAQVRKKFKNEDDELWKIKKVLEESDVGNLSRLMVGRELAEEFVMPMLGDGADKVNEGVVVQIWDVDTESMHSLVFRKWVSCKSYVFKSNWRKDFVKRRGLKKGDEIGLQWNPFKNCFQFSLLKVNFMG